MNHYRTHLLLEKLGRIRPKKENLEKDSTILIGEKNYEDKKP